MIEREAIRSDRRRPRRGGGGGGQQDKGVSYDEVAERKGGRHTSRKK